MRTKKLIVAGVLALVAANGAVAKNKDNSSYLNGKPFDELNQSIQQNAALIQQNADSIAALKLDVDAIEGDIQLLTDRVTANELAISDANAAIDQANGDIAAVRSDLYDLAASRLVRINTLFQHSEKYRHARGWP